MTETFDLLVSKLVSQLYVTRATFTSVLGVSAFFESGQALNGQTDRQTDRQIWGSGKCVLVQEEPRRCCIDVRTEILSR